MNENATARTGIVAVWDYCRTLLDAGTLRETALPRLREVLILAALVAGLYYLAKITWLLLPLPEPAAPAPLAPSLVHPATLQPPPPPPTDVQALGDWRLFGNPQAEKFPPEAAAETSAPPPPKEIDTKELRLRGVILNPGNPENARASIAQKNQAQWYNIAETLEGRDTVVANIAKDHVVLQEGELSTTLYLFPKKDPKQKDDPENLKVIDMRENKRATTVAAKYKKRLVEKPDTLAQLLHFSTVRQDGDTIGYRIRPKRSRSDFFALGLKSGDIINSINGTELDSLLSLQSVQHNLEHDTEIRVRITRQKKPVELVVKLQ